MAIHNRTIYRYQIHASCLSSTNAPLRWYHGWSSNLRQCPQLDTCTCLGDFSVNRFLRLYFFGTRNRLVYGTGEERWVIAVLSSEWNRHPCSSGACVWKDLVWTVPTGSAELSAPFVLSYSSFFVLTGCKSWQLQRNWYSYVSQPCVNQ